MHDFEKRCFFESAILDFFLLDPMKSIQRLLGKICCDKCTEFLIYFFRSMTDRKFAFEALREAGAYLTTSERIILGLAPDAAHPKFRQLQKLVMDSAADTGLVQ